MGDWRGRKVGNYVLVERLGQGGMGVVYRARDTMLDRDVALKMMQPPGEEQTRAEIAARFFVEAKAAARIQSRHVAQVLQLGETHEGEVYIVMELLVGEALSRAIQKEGRLEAARAVRIARQIARGMQAAHTLGVVHRDLKPANVMLVSADGEDDVVKILDFGVAKLTRDEGQQNLTQTGALLGTLPYMAPEQILGKPVDARTDIYALGVLLYRMLAGAPLFDAESLSDVVRHQVQTPPPPFSERVPGLVVPRAVERVVMRCLEKDPARRYPSMADVEAALTRALERSEESASTSRAGAPRIEETLPTGTRLPPGAATALVPVTDETRAALAEPAVTDPNLGAPEDEDAPQRTDELPVFREAPITQPSAPAVQRSWLPIAAAVAVVLALVAVVVAAILVITYTPPDPTPIAQPSTPVSSGSEPSLPTAPSSSPASPPPAPTQDTPEASPSSAQDAAALTSPTAAPTEPQPAGAASPAPTSTAPAAPAPEVATNAPSAKAPATKAPATKAPATKAPATKAPAAKAPTGKAPAAKAPATKAPATKAPETSGDGAGGFRRVLTKEGG